MSDTCTAVALAERGDMDMVTQLLSGGAAPHPTNEREECAASLALQHGHLEVVRQLLAVSDDQEEEQVQVGATLLDWDGRASQLLGCVGPHKTSNAETKLCPCSWRSWRASSTPALRRGRRPPSSARTRRQWSKWLRSGRPTALSSQHLWSSKKGCGWERFWGRSGILASRRVLLLCQLLGLVPELPPNFV